MFDVNLLAVFVMAIVHFALSFLWYSPALFGTTWMEAKGFKKEEACCSPKTCSAAFFVALFVSIVLAQFVTRLEVDTFVEGAQIGFMAWLGFVATTHMSSVLWARCPIKVFFINTGIMLISLCLMGGVFAIWQ